MALALCRLCHNVPGTTVTFFFWLISGILAVEAIYIPRLQLLLIPSTSSFSFFSLSLIEVLNAEQLA